MARFRFFNRTLPQTLLVATYLLYINIVFDILFGRIRHPISGILTLAFIVGVLGIVNERRFGYITAVVAAGVNMLWEALLVITVAFLLVLNLIFAIALFALLIHPMSRDYQRIWFH